MSTDSLIASPYRSLRAATVANRPAGATGGTSRRPYIAQAIAAPTTTSASAPIETGVNSPLDAGGVPTTGARKFTSRLSRMRKAPAPAEPMASTTIGEVITGGASCGCTVSSQRRSPVKVISTTLVM